VAGGWVRLENEVLHNVHISLNTIGMTEPRRMRWVSYEACMENTRNAYKILEHMKGKSHLEDLGIDGRILEWIL